MDSSLAAAVLVELRAFVREAGNRRTLPATCHVGHPGGERSRFAHHEVDHPSLRADLVVRAIDGLSETSGACAWVTRSGGLHLTDPDAGWFAAARTGFGRHGLDVPAFFVLNRTGWVDLVSGERREWSRVRATQTGQVCTGSLACISSR
jgi:hypothetical protein